MTPTDWLIVFLLFLGAVYGVVRGLRAALFAAAALFASLLAAAVLTAPMERLVLDLAGVGSENYPGAPAVAVLILEGRETAAWAAAFLPSFLALFPVLVAVVGSVFLKRIFVEPSRGVFSRGTGVLVGFVAGTALALIFVVQLLRLPSPPASRMFRGSLLIATVNHVAPDILQAFSGGL